jgi:hypothetical protein
MRSLAIPPHPGSLMQADLSLRLAPLAVLVADREHDPVTELIAERPAGGPAG